MTLHKALETKKNHSVVGNTKNAGLLYQRPFRSPHHTISNEVVLNVGVCYKYINYPPINVSLTYLRGLEIAELKEEDMPMVCY